MAAPTLDGTATAQASNASTYTVTLTTTQANDVICVLAFSELAGAATGTISSITATGLTFVKRCGSANNNAGQVNDYTELWWAVATSALSSAVITLHMSGTYDDTVCLAFGVHGCYTAAPWDTNASVPKALSSASTGAPSFSGVSSDAANCFLIFANGSPSAWNSIGTVPSGFTSIGFRFNGGGAQFASIGAACLGVTSAVSSQTYAWGSTVPAGGTNACRESVFDILTADAPVSASARPVVFACT